jgi:hypothetical protein
VIMADSLVTIAQLSDYVEAGTAGYLPANRGIVAVAAGENAATVCSEPAVEGPEPQVLKSQAQKEREILESQTGPEQ